MDSGSRPGRTHLGQAGDRPCVVFHEGVVHIPDIPGQYGTDLFFELFIFTLAEEDGEQPDVVPGVHIGPDVQRP